MGKNSKRKSKPQASNIMKTLTSELLQKCIMDSSASSSPKDRLKAYKEIQELVENIEEKKAASVVSEMKPREDCIKEFIDWANKQSILCDSVEVRKSLGDELGVFASRTLAPGELLIKVPKSAMMTAETVSNSPIGRIVSEDPMLSKMPNVALAFLLVYELFNENSKWQPYLNVLPRTYSNILYFDIADVEMLKGTSIYLDVLNVLKSIARQYAYIMNLLLNHPIGKQLGLAEKMTYADYKWAVATLMTRQNSIPSCNGAMSRDSGIALIPFLDLCNHAEIDASVDFNEESQSCECFTPIAVEKGGEIMINYGTRPNTELVIYNGFFFQGNSHDNIKLKLSISKTDPDYDSKNILIRNLAVQDVFYLDCLPSPLSDCLIAFLFISNATHTEVESMLRLDQNELRTKLNKECVIVSNETKIKGFKFLKDRCCLLLQLLPMLSPSDGEAPGGNLRHTTKLSFDLRNNERRILKDAIVYIDKLLENFVD
eukprot:gene12142-13395_t